ncbi:hypothetical protein KUH03_08465 [Sphingobacterium sp. E70]|uniref:hypothetical protein n=1 Tax=Sphingobacterium sp. E70 TaxID=2853439 RepID=UPI00211D096C|nr:hypothetical protein [Sphingobacterium sp. E70]ULT26844.1 hypothetical protein KUH03_08465 [Sphingobacterium sp. E70]
MRTTKNSWLRTSTLLLLSLGIAYGAQSFTEKDAIRVEKRLTSLNGSMKEHLTIYPRLLILTIILPLGRQPVEVLRRQSAEYLPQKIFQIPDTRI